jgi:hypothetical protein
MIVVVVVATSFIATVVIIVTKPKSWDYSMSNVDLRLVRLHLEMTCLTVRSLERIMHTLWHHSQAIRPRFSPQQPTISIWKTSFD